MIHPEYMGAPTHPLLGAADSYSFPMTSGLLGNMRQPTDMLGPSNQSNQPTDWTQVALNLAGNPHAGPYANAPGLAPLTGSAGLQAGSNSGGSSTVMGLLGALTKNPSLVKNGINAVSGLLGGGLGAAAAADAAAADAAIGSTVAPELASTASGIQAANDAALASQLASEGAAGGAAAGSGAAGGSAAAAGGSAAGAASALGIAALPAILAATVPSTDDHFTPDMIASMESGLKAGGNPSEVYANPQANYGALTDLLTLQLSNPTMFGQVGGTGGVNQFLTGLGYAPNGQAFTATAAPGGPVVSRNRY